MVRALVELRPGFHVALAAEVDGEPVGIARWIRYGADSLYAELAVEVVDAMQGRGIGRRLAAAAAQSALDAGVGCLTLWVDPQRHRLRERLLSVGARTAADDRAQLRLSPTALLSGAAAAR